MTNFQEDDHFQVEFRAKLYSSQVDSGLSIPQLAEKLGLESGEVLGDHFRGKTEMPLTLLNRYARQVNRPIWWFFGEQPSTISIEAAENAMTNMRRVKLYLEAVETEFKNIIAGKPSTVSVEIPIPKSSEQNKPVVVDFAPYLKRARAILEQEAECTEDSEEVFEESVEMIAHRLYSIEMAAAPSREFVPSN